jgi:hypothetical protein
MNKKILFPIIISIVTILFFNQINIILIDLNFSWTVSKMSPYILLLISGAMFFALFTGIIFNKIISLILRFLLLILPFIIGFIFHPIYEGDFSNNSVTPNDKVNNFEKINNGLSVVAIAGCPFCLESIGKLKLIKKRNPKLNIDFIVCTKDIKIVKDYQKIAGNSINVRLAQNSDSLAGLVGWRFPTFLEKKNDKLSLQWSNDNFGVRAVDQFESNYNSK